MQNREKLRILLLNDYGTLAGGAEVQVVTLRDQLRARGHEVALFSSSARVGPGANHADHTCAGTSRAWRTPLQVANPHAWMRLREVMASFQPDVVHVSIMLTQLSPLVLPLLRAVPSVYYAVWYRSVCPTGTKMLPDGTSCMEGWGRACRGCLSRSAWPLMMAQMSLWDRWRSAFDVVVANSEETLRHLRAGGIEVDAVIGHGVPEGTHLAEPAERPTVVFAGRLVPEKGFDVLLRAFARVAEQLPDAQLLVAGDGPEREDIERLVRTLGLGDHVVMLGHLPVHEVGRRLVGAWVQAVPSRWQEPFGMVAAEAMMRGTAVVATESGGLRDLVSPGETGLLVAPEDVEGWTAALTTLLSDRALAERMGRRGREVALARHTASAQADRFLDLYGRLLQESERARAPDGLSGASRPRQASWT